MIPESWEDEAGRSKVQADPDNLVRLCHKIRNERRTRDVARVKALDSILSITHTHMHTSVVSLHWQAGKHAAAVNTS